MASIISKQMIDAICKNIKLEILPTVLCKIIIEYYIDNEVMTGASICDINNHDHEYTISFETVATYNGYCVIVPKGCEQFNCKCDKFHFVYCINNPHKYINE